MMLLALVLCMCKLVAQANVILEDTYAFVNGYGGNVTID